MRHAMPAPEPFRGPESRRPRSRVKPGTYDLAVRPAPDPIRGPEPRRARSGVKPGTGKMS